MELRYQQVLSWPPDAVFAFFHNTANLQRIMDVGFRLLSRPGEIGPHAEFWFEITLAGCVPLVLGFRQTIYEPPTRFAEELIHGPFEFLEHIHEFHGKGQGTVVDDFLRVKLARVYGGEVLTRLVVAPLLDRAFRVRHRRLEELTRTPPSMPADNLPLP
jgi:ligand-binding SRPBCC domain-containing protein